ncbi:hypothetical protein D9M71_660240 [compost metagenome]
MEIWSRLLPGRTVAPAVTVHLPDRYFSLAGKDLSLPCALGTTAAKREATEGVPLPPFATDFR